MPGSSIDMRVWQRVSENPLFCSVSWCIWHSATDFPKILKFKRLLCEFHCWIVQPAYIWGGCKASCCAAFHQAHTLLVDEDPSISMNYLNKGLFLILNFKVLGNTFISWLYKYQQDLNVGIEISITFRTEQQMYLCTNPLY